MELFSSLKLFFVFLSVFCCFFQVKSDSKECMEYTVTSVEYSLTHPDNLKQLVQAFFPTDRQTSIIVDVTYIIRRNISIVAEDEIVNPQCSSSDYTLNRILREEEGNESFIGIDANLHYRWAASAVNLFVGPDILEMLSLFVFHVDIAPAILTIEIPSSCSPVDNEIYCNENEVPHVINILNEVTSNVSIS